MKNQGKKSKSEKRLDSLQYSKGIVCTKVDRRLLKKESNRSHQPKPKALSSFTGVVVVKQKEQV